MKKSLQRLHFYILFSVFIYHWHWLCLLLETLNLDSSLLYSAVNTEQCNKQLLIHFPPLCFSSEWVCVLGGDGGRPAEESFSRVSALGQAHPACQRHYKSTLRTQDLPTGWCGENTPTITNTYPRSSVLKRRLSSNSTFTTERLPSSLI